MQVKKPLRITFYSNGVREDGIDQGGVTKEFFQLVTRALFNEVRSTLADAQRAQEGPCAACTTSQCLRTNHSQLV